MFVPGQYRVDEHAWHRRIVAEHPLATLVTNGDPVPHGTRLPALVAPGQPESGPLVGTEVYGHLNRANPHWKALLGGTAARLMFDGPNAFVSPSVYQETLAVVRWTAERLEQRFGAGWDPSSSIDYFRRLLPAVGAFRLRIDAVEAMFKLSQEKDVEVQESVIRRYEDDEGGAARPLARLMREVGIGHPAEAARGCPF
jgi:transcriptional regulator